MKKLKVIGIGSRIMGDDGIGVYVVEALIKQRFLSGIEDVIGETDIKVEYVLGETDYDYCFDFIENTSMFIIIDAAISGNKPGTVTQFTTNNDTLFLSKMFSLHNLNLIDASRILVNARNLVIIGIEPETIDYQLGLSTALSKAFIPIIENVKKCILASGLLDSVK